MSRRFQVVVVGGGPAGSVAALTIARSGATVLLVEGAPARDSEFRIGETLPPATKPLLRDLGLLDQLLWDGHLPCHGNLSIWGSDDAQCTNFMFNPHGHGWHLDRIRFDRRLREHARQRGATLFQDTRMVSANRTETAWKIELQSDRGGPRQPIHADWVVDATGRSAFVALRNGARRIHDDRMIGFYVRTRTAAPDLDRDQRTWIEATPSGWWYTAALPSRERVAAFFTDPVSSDTTALLTQPGFEAQLPEAAMIHHMLKRCRHTIASCPAARDASSSRLNRCVGIGWLAVGDAAFAMDPLSSQGIFNAMYGGLRGAEAIVQVIAGKDGSLKQYESRMSQVYEAYWSHRSAAYAAERRWPESEFWQRRAAAHVEPRVSRMLSPEKAAPTNRD